MNRLVLGVSAAAGGLLYLLGALSLQAIDREIPPATVATLEVQQVTTTEQHALHLLQSVARDHRVNLLRVGSNPSGPNTSPWYFAFVGDQAVFNHVFPGGEYRAFAQREAPKIFPGTDLVSKNQSIRGLYAAQGARSDAAAAASVLTAHGLQTEVSLVRPVIDYVGILAANALWPLLVTAVIASTLSIVHWVSSTRRASAVRQLHGRRSSRIVLGQAVDIALTYGIALTFSLAAGTAVLWSVNGWNQFGRFLPYAVIPMMSLVVVGFSTQLLTSVLVLRLPAHAAIKGARPRRLLGFTAGASQAVMVVLLFAVLAQAGETASSLVGDARSFQSWSRERHSLTAEINPYAFEDPETNEFTPDVVAAYAAFGALFAQMDRDDTAVLSIHTTDRQTSGRHAPLESYEPLRGNSMIVNNAYLRRQEIITTEGARLTSITPEAGVITLLIPERLAAHEDALVASWSASTLAASDPINGSRSEQRFVVRSILVADGQELFNYGSTQKMNRWTQTSPVVAVVSPESHYLSDWVLLGIAANDGHVVFTDPHEFRSLSNAAGLTQRFSGVSSPAALASQQLRERQGALALSFGSAIAGLVTLAITVGLLTSIYADAVRLSSFVRRVHGWSTARVHGLFLAAVIVGSALMALTGAFLARLVDLAAEPLLITVAVSMTCVMSVLTVVATASIDRRVRATLIKRR